MSQRRRATANLMGSPHAIWVFAAAYFACYLPFTGLTKAMSRGLYPGTGEGIPGPVLLPLSALASLVVMILFLTATGWWAAASTVQVGRWRIPRPTRWTALSGVCTAGILMTATLAYTFV